ncbi:MAG: hypothetical protein QOC96_599 [Acidobacteriota bacterium]|jgi:glycosyltransferase involved in cell wall biosynthesis|nr:hypothetical protein [Acidobacteriota bacterium]
MMTGVTVSHPHGNPNSYHTAKAFADAGLLQSFEQGFANRGFTSKVLSKLPGSRNSLKREFENLPTGSQRQHLFWEGISQLGRRLKTEGPTKDVSWYDILFYGHDWQVSKALNKEVNAVYAYEDGACNTFHAAKRTNKITIYELPAGYYAGVANELRGVKERLPELELDIKIEPQWKTRRKNREVQLADLIIVPCEWARESLRFNSIAKEKLVIKVPYGTPSDEVSTKSKRPTGPFTALFAGNISARKGVPYLLDAWSQLGLKNAQLWLVGGMRLGAPLLKQYSGMFKHFEAMSHRELLELMKKVDLLVFPSLAEGFGLVIGEAMAVGTPVLTTINTGGPELIMDGQEGWCIPPHSVRILKERIEWAYLHREELFNMGQLARQKAEKWTWAHYRQSLIEKLSPYLT